MRSFDLQYLISQAAGQDERYLEFLRVPSLSMGVYTLPAGGEDLQSPHNQDEVYYVVRGKAVLQVEQEQQPALPGSLLFVPAHAAHKFVNIEEELQLLVFFAPAEG
ncbi:MAG: cupin domain-containing protein [Anaerolineales bacterium]|nr:cupin domain-containing protein [Anaerolineales bacterium]